ncbi:hypothetical protein [Salibaculum griseiflavum]|uniref:Uncharacterized protein n=1 Tax=Salibaculum griseiflavum TaxID=1914409 RepID=A0A2V1P2A4_9RHOB|nr:hypothetical protein [Salibaculum griseiflavum]PWG15974.1 hypothetical protein DFK10_14425 [Salibaculum griseiflavum]
MTLRLESYSLTQHIGFVPENLLGECEPEWDEDWSLKNHNAEDEEIVAEELEDKNTAETSDRLDVQWQPIRPTLEGVASIVHKANRVRGLGVFGFDQEYERVRVLLEDSAVLGELAQAEISLSGSVGGFQLAVYVPTDRYDALLAGLAECDEIEIEVNLDPIPRFFSDNSYFSPEVAKYLPDSSIIENEDDMPNSFLDSRCLRLGLKMPIRKWNGNSFTLGSGPIDFRISA